MDAETHELFLALSFRACEAARKNRDITGTDVYANVRLRTVTVRLTCETEYGRRGACRTWPSVDILVPNLVAVDVPFADLVRESIEGPYETRRPPEPWMRP